MAPSNYYVLVLAHGVVMALALLWFIPIAIFAAKFFRSVDQPVHDKHTVIHKRSHAWKYVHITMNIIATMLIIAGFTLGYYASGNSFQLGTKNAHFASLPFRK